MTDPKPPAASGDRFDEMAEKTWAELNAKAAGVETIAAALRAAAKEAQLRVLDELWPDYDAAALRRQIEKEGPL